MPSKKYLDYNSFVAFFHQNGFAFWNDHVIKTESELPSREAYEQWRAPLLLQEAAERGSTEVSVLKNTITLTHEQVKPLPTGPFDLVLAPGPGKLIMPIAGMVTSHIMAPYTNIEDSGILSLYLFLGGDVAFGNVPSATVKTLLSADAQFQLCPGAVLLFESGDPDVVNSVLAAGQPKSNRTLSDAINQPLKCFIDNYTADYQTNLGNLTGGDPDNTLTFTILYTIV
jgi:hypothetical protein